MNNRKANKSIQCTVSECIHHCGNMDYCALDTVQIGTHENEPKQKQCVDCESFSLSDYPDR